MSSEADERVLRYLSTGAKRTAEVGRNCFAGGKARKPAATVLAAAAHLRRMEERGMVVSSSQETKHGLVWRVAPEGGGGVKQMDLNF